MAPLVDIVFLLLIFFMVTSNFMKPVLQMDLPGAKGGDKRDDRSTILSVDKSLQFYIDGIQVNRDQLVSNLTQKIQSSESQNIIFRGDREIPYGIFVSILGAARQAGFPGIQIEHEEELP